MENATAKAVILAILCLILSGLIAVSTANAASHLPDCKADAGCLFELYKKWKTITAADMQAMINSGAYVNATNDEGVTPLHAAATFGNAGVIPVLLKAGADVNAKNNNGSTPLGIAEPIKNSDVISALKSTGAKSKKSKYERKSLSIDGLVEYNFVSNPQCRTSRRGCVVIEAKTIQGCPRSLYMSLILFDGQNRNIGFTNAVAHDLQKGESALLEFSIIEKNVASYRVGKINCHQ